MHPRPRPSRRGRLLRLAILICGAVLLAAPSPTGAGGLDREVPDFPETTEESKQAVERGLAWLKDNQEPDGSFGKDKDFKVAITSIACLSFMANGNVPGRGKYGETVRRGLRYILDCGKLNTNGYITEPGESKSRMHGHGYATMFLAQVLGMAEGVRGIETADLRSALRKAVDVIVSSQTMPRDPQLGGWGYEPDPSMPDEASVTITAVQALRAARDAGINVSAEGVIDRAIQYVKTCYDRKTMSFRYSIVMNNRHSSFALAAAAVSVLNYAGAYDAEEIRGGLEFMMSTISHGGRGTSGHYFYECFYATLAFYNAGGSYWKLWCPRIREELVRSQKSGGSWENEYSEQYGTAFATLILQIPNRYLPIFQR